MGGVEAPQALRGVRGVRGVRRYPPPHWGKGLSPLPRKLFIFLLKIPYFDTCIS